MLELVLDLLWMSAIHVGSYHLWHIFLEKHATVLKDLFNIDVRYYNYNREESTTSQHEILYTLASTTMVICMAITPFIHSAIYLVFFNMIDVVQINTILLSIVAAKLLWFVNIRNKECTLRPWKYVNQLFLVTQFLFIVVNYQNTTSVIPSVFQIIDEAANVEGVLVAMSKHYLSLFNTDSTVSSKISTAIVVIKKRKAVLRRAHLGFLATTVVISILCSNLRTAGEVAFYYYAVGRILHINLNATT